MTTHLFEETDINCAYGAVHRFFDIFCVQHAIQYIESALLAACNKKIWQKEVPAQLLFFIECLEALSKAMFAINYECLGRKGAIIEAPAEGVPDIAATANYVDTYHHSNVWNNFPRYFNAAQYHDPFKAIKKFCKHKAPPEWKKFFQDLIEYAFSKSSIDDGEYGAYEILKTRLRLLQMVEAAHLIEVRTYQKVRIEPKFINDL